MDECAHDQTEGSTESADDDRRIGTFLPVGPLAAGYGTRGNTGTRSSEHGRAKRPTTQSDFPERCPRELSCSGGSLEGEAVVREACQATCGPVTRLISDPQLIIDVDDK